MAITIVKSDDPSITRTGTWAGAGLDVNMFSTNRYYLQCTGTATPSGTYRLRVNGLTPGLDYLLAFTLDGLSNRQADQPIKIYDSDGTTLLDAMVINGQLPFDDFTYTTGASRGTPKWIWVGKYTPSGTSLTLYTDNSGSDATKYAIVDAVYCQLTTDAYTPVYAPKRSGNWSSSATWKMGAIPGATEPIVLKTQSPATLTVDSNISQGPSGVAGTVAVTIKPGCSLVVADGATFQARGDVILEQTGTTRVANYFPLQIGTGTNGGGAIFEFDGSLAASPSTAAYVVGPTAYGQPNTWIKIRGTTGNRAKVRSNAGGAKGRFSRRDQYTNASGGLMMFDAEDCDFSDLGDNGATHSAGFPNRAFDVAPRLAGEAFNLTRCSITNCYGGDEIGSDGIVRCELSGAGAAINFIDVTFSGNASTCQNNTYITASTLPGASSFVRSEFDRRFWLLLGSNFGTTTLQSNMYLDAVWYGASPSGSTALDDGHFYHMTHVTDRIPTYEIAGNVTRPYLSANKVNGGSSATQGNPHYVSPTGSCTMSGGVVDSHVLDGDDCGDAFDDLGTSGKTHIFRDMVILKGNGGTVYGSGAVWRGGAGTSTVSLEKCVIYIQGVLGGFQVGHGAAAGNAGSIPYARDTIWYTENGSPTYAFNSGVSATLIQDFIDPTGITCNNFFGPGVATGTNNIVAGVPGQSIFGMQGLKLSALPTGNLNLDPMFVDSDRNGVEYGRAVLGLTGTDQQVIDGLLDAVSTDKTLTLDIVEWIRDGLKTTNPLLATAAHDGAAIGIGYADAATSSATTISLCDPGDGITVGLTGISF